LSKQKRAHSRHSRCAHVQLRKAVAHAEFLRTLSLLCILCALALYPVRVR